MKGRRSVPGLLALLASFVALFAGAAAHGQAPAPPSDLKAVDHDWDNGKKVTLTWTLSPDDMADDPEAAAESDRAIDGYQVFAATTAWTDLVALIRELGYVGGDDDLAAVSSWAEERGFDPDRVVVDELLALFPEGDRERAAGVLGRPGARSIRLGKLSRDRVFKFVDVVRSGVDTYVVNDLQRGESYRFQVLAHRGAEKSTPATSEALTTQWEWFDGGRVSLFIIAFIFCGAVIYWIYHARTGGTIRVRKIAGLEAVDEAVGRATEMGRSCLYIPGIQDINEIQTIASMTVLARVAKTAAEYDAKVEVPTARSLVMTTARETVQAAYLAAGRPDAYNKDLIYYVTDEQFGYVAYLQGMMVREKPAACFYMGVFYAESLILAECGNSIGAIQVAGTAMPAQLPFFVAACDYTLIGEEFFAASAYLSGSAEELGSLKGQDVGKIVVSILLLIGVVLATGAEMFGGALGEQMQTAVDYLRQVILT